MVLFCCKRAALVCIDFTGFSHKWKLKALSETLSVVEVDPFFFIWVACSDSYTRDDIR